MSVGQTTVQSRHITELRDAINALRSHMGMSAYSWQFSATTNDWITASPILEMRTALDQALGSPSGGYSSGLAQGQTIKAIHIQELRDRVLGAWVSFGSTDIRWLVSDQLGTPRMSFDQSGNLSGVSRHDYLPFGEELFAGQGARTVPMGFGASDNVRQKFTGYERDAETGLDFAQARYHANMQGRFTSPDPGMAGADQFEPQSWNGYSYVGNNPLNRVDPLGLYFVGGGTAETNLQDPDHKPVPPSDWLTIPVDRKDVIITNIDLDNKTGKYLTEGEAAFRKLRNFMGASLADEFDLTRSRADSMPSVRSADDGEMPENVGGLRLGWEWATGTGPKHREFGPSMYATRQMMTSPDVAYHRQQFIQQGGGNYGPKSLKFGMPWNDNPLRAGFNFTRQAVGSFTITIQEQTNGDALFSLTNVTSTKSFLYDFPGVQNHERSEMRAMGNISQEFWWYERGIIKH